RDFHVTGVQTCALPILDVGKSGAGWKDWARCLSGEGLSIRPTRRSRHNEDDGDDRIMADTMSDRHDRRFAQSALRSRTATRFARSEERRVGEADRVRGA